MTDMQQEAQRYSDRNRGNAEKWFDYTDMFNNPKPKERVITDEAKKNAETNKGSMKDIFGGYADPPIQRSIHPRAVRSEATVSAEGNKGDAMKELMDNYGTLSDTHVPARKLLGEEAIDNAAKNNGVNNLINNYGNLDLSERPAPRLGHGGEEIAEKHDGADMAPIMRMEGERSPSPKETKISKLHQESETCWDEIPPARRIRPEAEDISNRQSGDSLNGIIHMDGDKDDVNSRWEVKTLSHLEQSKTPRSKTSPSRTRPEALRNYQKSRGSEMGSILKMEPPANSAPRKVNRMFLKSEEW